MTRTDTASRHVAAPPDRVFAALLSREALESWLPPDGMSGSFEHFDARPGGTYRLVLTYRDAASAHGKSTAESDVVEATFVQIVPGERVVFDIEFVAEDPSFAGTMRMTWSVEPADGGTRVVITADDVPAGISQADHQVGMSSSLANLAAFVEQPARPLGA